MVIMGDARERKRDVEQVGKGCRDLAYTYQLFICFSRTKRADELTGSMVIRDIPNHHYSFSPTFKLALARLG
jgi:hypothetical protein